jgi:hypothetical protein
LSLFLATVIRQTYRAEIDPQVASKIAYMLNILKGCMEVADLAERIEALEAQLQHPDELRAVG